MKLDDIKESALMAFDTLRTNKLRSSLTILGVSVGVVTVIFMVSIIQGLNKAFADQIESLGSNTIFVSKFEPSFGRPPGPEEIHRKDLTMADAEALRNEAPSIAGVSPAARMLSSTMSYQDKFSLASRPITSSSKRSTSAPAVLSARSTCRTGPTS
jgi:putative ABC transport system permease protein